MIFGRQFQAHRIAIQMLLHEKAWTLLFASFAHALGDAFFNLFDSLFRLAHGNSSFALGRRPSLFGGYRLGGRRGIGRRRSSALAPLTLGWCRGQLLEQDALDRTAAGTAQGGLASCRGLGDGRLSLLILGALATHQDAQFVLEQILGAVTGLQGTRHETRIAKQDVPKTLAQLRVLVSDNAHPFNHLFRGDSVLGVPIQDCGKMRSQRFFIGRVGQISHKDGSRRIVTTGRRRCSSSRVGQLRRTDSIDSNVPHGRTVLGHHWRGSGPFMMRRWYRRIVLLQGGSHRLDRHKDNVATHALLGRNVEALRIAAHLFDHVLLSGHCGGQLDTGHGYGSNASTMNGTTLTKELVQVSSSVPQR
jgi:hypothetical protein